MTKTKYLIIAALIVVAPAAWAQQDTSVQVMKAPGTATIKGTNTVKATVQEIDAATRTVVLKTSNGRIVEVEVGEEARNFDQLKVGDIVTAVYHESLTLNLKKRGGAAPSVEETPTAERTPAGDKPGGSVGREVKIVANVVAVNPKKQTITLRGPKGNTLDLIVQDPTQFADIRKGDQVDAVYTEALAISVEPAISK
jgi:Cu/Ag efflux protein CusF